MTSEARRIAKEAAEAKKAAEAEAKKIAEATKIAEQIRAADAMMPEDGTPLHPRDGEEYVPSTAGIKGEFHNDLLEFPQECIHTKKAQVVTLTYEEISEIIRRVADLHGIHFRTALAAIGEMIRKGGANKATPLSLTVDIFCPAEKVEAGIQKRDIERIIKIVTTEKSPTKTEKTFRDLANTLARDLIMTSIKKQEKTPWKDFSGDLAKKINNRLVFRKEQPLTQLERIGCASYAQHLEDLNQLTNSYRLASLLAEDLEMRNKERLKQTKQNKGFNQGPRRKQNTVQKPGTSSENKTP